MGYMNTNPSSWSRLLSRYAPFIAIFVLSILPVIFTWNKAIIGGDTTIPFNSGAIYKYLYQWISVQNGSYLSANYYPLYFFYKLAEVFGLGFYQTSSLLLFLLNLIAGIGIYKLAKLYDKGDHPYTLVLPISFYLLSPALLNGWHYLYIYSFSPWFFFFVLNFIKKGQIKILDLILLNITIFFASLDLPNPKYIFYLLLATLIIVTTSCFLKLIDTKFLLRTFFAATISLFLSAYLVLPLGNFILQYSPSNYGVSVNPGNNAGSKMMDFGSATMDKMFSLHHGGINLNKEERESYLKNPLLTVLGYLYLFVILIDILTVKRKKEDDKTGMYKLIFLVLIVLFLSLSTGSNPPFGFVYEFFVTHFRPLAFLRTTAGAVFFLSLFYSVYLFILVQEQEKRRYTLALVLVVATFITGYPILSGDIYENNTNVNQYAGKDRRGFVLPPEYFTVSTLINRQKLDTKTLYPGLDSSYISTRWGYFGPLFYSLAYQSSPITENMVVYNQAYHNIGLTFVDESAVDEKKRRMPPLNQIKLFKGKNVSLYKTEASNFLPHLYVPSMAAKKLTVPVLEFKKIDPTKYRVRVHGAKNDFPLIFSEAFHSGWKLYFSKQNDTYPSKGSLLNQLDDLSHYKILDGNEYDQATSEQLKDFIENGYVSYLGEKDKNPFIDFVSKNYQGTVQNDNLVTGSFYETWFKSPVSQDSHRTINGYANSWDINLSEICHEEKNCIRNADGSYDFEVIVEFWPQRVFYFGLSVSIITISGLLTLSFFKPRLTL